MKVQVIICGAGIAGVSAAYHLAVRHAVRDILLVDERPPLTLTSDKSTECYRNWWPGPGTAMVSLMNRSIDILEGLAQESGNVFHLNRRGYLYITADPQRVGQMLAAAQEPPSLGAGELRLHRDLPDDPAYVPSPIEGYQDVPDGADLFLDTGLLHRTFPYISTSALAALHVRRAGWFSAQQLGAYLVDQARRNGVRLVTGRVTGVQVSQNRVRSISLANGDVIHTECFVNAAGPHLRQVGTLLGVDLPVVNELHLKVALHDTLEAVPRHAPLLIWNDPQCLPWSDDEHQALADAEDTRGFLDEMPAGAHTRPEGGRDSDIILLLWEYRTQTVEPVFPPPLDAFYPELALRSLSSMLPGLSAYFQRLPRPVLDGGYYTKTKENRPLIGPLPVQGAYVIGALSGFGLMASCAAGELLAAHLTGSPLPEYAPAFMLDRYADPGYLALLEQWGETGQL